MVEPVHKQLWIDGCWHDANGGARFPVEDPATGRTLCEVADAVPADAATALGAATNAQPGFAATPPRERGEILRRGFEIMVERVEQLAVS